MHLIRGTVRAATLSALIASGAAAAAPAAAQPAATAVAAASLSAAPSLSALSECPEVPHGSVGVPGRMPGRVIRHLQCLLNECGYSVPVDGIYGPSLERALRDFQHRHSLPVDGFVGPQTWEALHQCGGEHHRNGRLRT